MDKTTRITVIFGTVAIVITILFTLLLFLFQPGNYFNIKSYDQCVAAGFEATNDNPPKCKDLFGNVYTSSVSVATTDTNTQVEDTPKEEVKKPETFIDCNGEGYELIEGDTYKCKTPEGETVELNVGNQPQLEEEILVFRPSIGGYLKDELILQGQAKKGWYTGSSISYQIQSEDGKKSYLSGTCPTESTISDDVSYNFSCTKTISPTIDAKAKLVIINPDKSKENLYIPVTLLQY
ncbi:hypothetical protein KC660_00550 [Candidatus Dojkabacteria bacterium]|uniref:Bacterial spore germination immunoglobulin-like domain-containing protein n=1 Tax=Candidatus Dojkabacteria bacterium TaxID=2099670 RepID=A0A955L2T8_9BACT|nr:hypothetical protein [Candidatus Dojkabacteria bacterium]